MYYSELTHPAHPEAGIVRQIFSSLDAAEEYGRYFALEGATVVIHAMVALEPVKTFLPARELYGQKR